MRARNAVALTAVAGLGVGLWLVTRDGRAERSEPDSTAPRSKATRQPGAKLPAPARRMTAPPARPEMPRTFKDPKRPDVTYMEVKDAVADPVREAEEKLLYRKRRLRFALSDAAAECWSGDDNKADIEVGYTLVVEHEVLRVEDLRMLDSTLPDPALEDCILHQIADLRAPADGIPDMREAGSSFISLHDLFVRNRGAADK
jgi:hypothetical protein